MSDLQTQIKSLFQRLSWQRESRARIERENTNLRGTITLLKQDLKQEQESRIEGMNQAGQKIGDLKSQLIDVELVAMERGLEIYNLKGKLVKAREGFKEIINHKYYEHHPSWPAVSRVVKIAKQTLAALDSEQESNTEPVKGEKCKLCGKRYSTVWRASYDAWYKITGSDSEYGFYCCKCFEELGRKKDIHLYWECDIGEWPRVKAFEDIKALASLQKEKD